MIPYAPRCSLACGGLWASWSRFHHASAASARFINRTMASSKVFCFFYCKTITYCKTYEVACELSSSLIVIRFVLAITTRYRAPSQMPSYASGALEFNKNFYRSETNIEFYEWIKSSAIRCHKWRNHCMLMCESISTRCDRRLQLPKQPWEREKL